MRMRSNLFKLLRYKLNHDIGKSLFTYREFVKLNRIGCHKVMLITIDILKASLA